MVGNGVVRVAGVSDIRKFGDPAGCSYFNVQDFKLPVTQQGHSSFSSESLHPVIGEN